MRNRNLWLAFAAFVVASGSRWIIATYLPSDLPLLTEQSLHELAIALGAGVVSWRFGKFTFNRVILSQLAVYGLLLLALPSILVSLSAGKVSELSGLALLTLVPAAVVLIAAQQIQGFGSAEGSRSILLPALAGAGGALLLIPVAIPSTFAGKVWLALLGLCCLPVALACIRLHRLLQQTNLPAGMAIVFGASGLATGCFSFGGLAIPWSVHSVIRELALCLLLDAPLAILAVWLLREMEPLRFSARYLLIPFVSILESIFLLRTGFTVSSITGLVLMLAGSVVLALHSGDETNNQLKLR